MAINEYGLELPADSDEFDPSGDLRALGNSMADSIVVPVVNETARDGLTLFAGLLVNRLDTGFLERYDGNDWTTFRPYTDSDWMSSGHNVTPSAGWSSTDIRVRTLGQQVFIVATLDRTGGTITGSTYGDMPNTAVLNLPTELTPTSSNGAFGSYVSGIMFSYAAYASGSITLLATTAGANVINGQTISLSGSYFL